MTETDRISEPSSRPPFTERVAAFLSPTVFFAAVAMGFVASVAAGYLSTQHNMFDNFIRIHELIGAETNFNVTAAEIQRFLATIPADKVVVVVGGTSRFHGVGQRPQELWSDHLQARLGSRYAVVNLALRAGRTEQLGAQAAEAMIKAGRPTLYVADFVITDRFVPGGRQPVYRYFYYDAMVRDMLLEWPIRDQKLEDFEKQLPQPEVARELRLRSRLNRWLYFDDLWTYVEYWYLSFAVWLPETFWRPFTPRGELVDREQAVPADGYYSRYDFNRVLNFVRQFAASLSASALAQLLESTQVFPPAMRARSLIVTIRQSPFYTDHFTAAERSAYDGNYAAVVDVLRRGEFHAADLGRDWAADDFVDGWHISEAGGRKLADAIAPLVAEMAHDLGYVQ